MESLRKIVWMHISALALVALALKMTPCNHAGIYIAHTKGQGLMSLIVPSENRDGRLIIVVLQGVVL